MQAALDACGVAYTVNPRLVRGLDYYTRTTFEFTVLMAAAWARRTLCWAAGGMTDCREMLGGPKAPGIGFAIGEDRLILTLQAQAAAVHARKNSTPTLRRWAWRRTPRRWCWRGSCAGLGLRSKWAMERFRLKKSFETADKAGSAEW